MSASGIPNQPLKKVEVYDSILRWTIPSRSNPEETYVADLGSYDGHGRCPCRDFTSRFEKFLQKGMTPEEVHRDGCLDHPLRDYQLGPEDCLSCWHIVQARRKLSWHVPRAFSRAERAQGGGREGA